MNYKKYVTAVLYALQVPLGVWTGFEFGKESYLLGGLLTTIMIVIEGFAVVTWHDGQTLEIREMLKKLILDSDRRPAL